jgi:hypothetical protein
VRHVLGTDNRRSARSILDHDGHAGRLGNLLRQHPSQQIKAASRRERYYEPHGSRSLRPGDTLGKGKKEAERSGAYSQPQSFTAMNFHFDSSDTTER